MGSLVIVVQNKIHKAFRDHLNVQSFSDYLLHILEWWLTPVTLSKVVKWNNSHSNQNLLLYPPVFLFAGRWARYHFRSGCQKGRSRGNCSKSTEEKRSVMPSSSARLRRYSSPSAERFSTGVRFRKLCWSSARHWLGDEVAAGVCCVCCALMSDVWLSEEKKECGWEDAIKVSKVPYYTHF